jgi:hypothetical protein
MYLRWKARDSTRTKYGRRRPDYGTVWSAAIVESVRVNGKPRQNHVAYLGMFTENGVDNVYVRSWYWDRLGQKLDRLANRMLSEQRQQIEAAFSERFPRVTKEQPDQCQREFQVWQEQARGIASAWGRRRKSSPKAGLARANCVLSQEGAS